jgi:hypothetical protein
MGVRYVLRSEVLAESPYAKVPGTRGREETSILKAINWAEGTVEHAIISSHRREGRKKAWKYLRKASAYVRLAVRYRSSEVRLDKATPSSYFHLSYGDRGESYIVNER